MVEHRVDIDDLRAQPLQRAQRGLADRTHLRVDRRVPERERPADLARGVQLGERAGPARIGHRQRSEVGGLWSDDRVEGERDVADRASHRPLRRQVSPARRLRPAGGNASQRRLHPGDAHRPPTGSGSSRRRRSPCTAARDRRRSPPPDPPEDPPALRVRSHGLHVAPKSGFTVSPLWPSSGVLVLPTTMQPAAFRRSTRGGVGGGDGAVGVHDRSLGGAEPGRVLEVLDPDRDAGERADVLTRRDPRVERGGLGQRLLALEGDEGVHPRVDLLDAVERGAHELASGDALGTHIGSEGSDGGGAEVHVGRRYDGEPGSAVVVSSRRQGPRARGGPPPRCAVGRSPARARRAGGSPSSRVFAVCGVMMHRGSDQSG